MLGSPLPTFRNLFLPLKNQEAGFWTNSLWLSKSGVSIRLIIENYKQLLNKTTVNLWIPDFFCAETEAEFSKVWLNIFRYPINRQLEPDWEKIKNKYDNNELDIFIFVHYFGKYRNISIARTYCDKKQAILIEDCAHVLFPNCKIGQKGDFILYSPHKLLPVPDGAILQSNKSFNKINSEIYNNIERMVSEKPNRWLPLLIWKVKKTIQKMTHLSKSLNYEYKEHYQERDILPEKNISISLYSYNIINSYSYEDLKTIAYLRAENLMVLSHIIKQIDPNILPLTDDEIKCPFFAVFSLENVKNKQNVISILQQLRIPILFWPTLNTNVSGLDSDCVARIFSKELFVVPIHQSISPQEIITKFGFKPHLIQNSLSIHKIENNTYFEKQWNFILSQAKLSNITQDWKYGSAKTKCESWNLDRFIISKNGKDIGVVQVLNIKKFGISFLARVNKGPIFIEPEQTVDNELETIEKIKSTFYTYIPFLYVPNSFMTAHNFFKITSNGWRCWNYFGFPSGTIDLTRDDKTFRASLNGKWRNQLTTSEKAKFAIKNGFNRFAEMLELYENEQKTKNFKGVSSSLLIEIMKLEDSPLRVFYIESENNDILAFDFFYKHSDAATYYVGWNSIEGRNLYLNNYLLYHSALLLKKEGVKILDLGGIEYIHTEQIARFKDGLNPQHYRCMGEFIRF